MKLQNVQFFRIYRNYCVIIGFNNCKKIDLIWISIENSIMLTEHRAGPYLKAISSTFGSRVVFKHMLDWVKWLGPLRKNGAYYEEKEASKTQYEENTYILKKIFVRYKWYQMAFETLNSGLFESVHKMRGLFWQIAFT